MHCGELSNPNLITAVKEYESVIDTLTTQVEFYAKEQEGLRKEMIILIKENKVLGQTVSELYQDKSINNQLEVEKVESDLVINLKTQLSLIMKEKDAVVDLWQTSLRNIDRLEEDMKLFEGRTHGYYSKAEVLKIKQVYENHIDDLQNKLMQSQSNLEETNKLLHKRNEDLERALAYQNNATSQIKTLEEDFRGLQLRLLEIVKMRDQLQLTLDNKKMLIEELKLKDVEAKSRVTEAIQLIEAACLEKDAAINRELEAKNDVTNLSKTLNEVIKESSEKLEVEIGKVKSEYNAKLENLQEVLKATQHELSNKSDEIDKYAKECRLLQNEVERIKMENNTVDGNCNNRLLILEKNLESTFQKLLLSEKKNLQLEAEKESIKLDLEQMSMSFKRDVQMREVSREILNNENQELKNQLQISKSKLQKLSNSNLTLKCKISSLDNKLKEKLIGQESVFKQNIVEVVENMEKKSMHVQNQLQTYLESQMALHKKWKKEVGDIVKKFENQLIKLRASNKSLRKRLRKALSDTIVYKNTLQDICTNINSSASRLNNETVIET